MLDGRPEIIRSFDDASSSISCYPSLCVVCVRTSRLDQLMPTEESPCPLDLGGHVNTKHREEARGRRRRGRHSDEFNADAVAATRQHGVSIAAVAMSRGVDANLLRRWVAEAERDGRDIAVGPAVVEAPARRLLPRRRPSCRWHCRHHRQWLQPIRRADLFCRLCRLHAVSARSTPRFSMPPL
jgi:transposase-like protein